MDNVTSIENHRGKARSLSRVLWELSEYFDENIEPHKNKLFLLGSCLSKDMIAEPYIELVAHSASNALEDILIEAAYALDDFREKLNNAHAQFKVQKDPGKEV